MHISTDDHRQKYCGFQFCIILVPPLSLPLAVSASSRSLLAEETVARTREGLHRRMKELGEPQSCTVSPVVTVSSLVRRATQEVFSVGASPSLPYVLPPAASTYLLLPVPRFTQHPLSNPGTAACSSGGSGEHRQHV